MRISENMKFGTAIISLGNVQSQYNTYLEQMATQKRINRISDDPLGMTMLLNYRQGQAEIDQYKRNIDNSDGWLNMTESKLTSAGNLLVKAKELALSQGTATATSATRRIAAENIEQLKQAMLALANSSYGGRYLFSGSRMDVAPFSSTYSPATIEPAVAATSNQFDGTALAAGTYTGASNNTYAVRIEHGDVLGAATYQLSTNGGKDWGTIQTVAATGVIALGDGISLTLTDSGANHLADGDMFSVKAFAAGYYQGNNAALTIDVGKETAVTYNITGGNAFGSEGSGVDIFGMLDSLKAALLSNDQAGITAQLDNLSEANNQINLSVARVGNTVNRMEVAKNNLQDLSLQLTDLTSKTEDADLAELATSLSMKQIALQASYATVSKISENTILNFLK